MKEVDEIVIDGLTRYELVNDAGDRMTTIHYNPMQGNKTEEDAAKEFLVARSKVIGKAFVDTKFYEMSLAEVAAIYRHNRIVGVTVIPDENCSCMHLN